MQLSLAVAKYPKQRYITPDEVDAISDTPTRERHCAANERLQAALDSYINLVNLLHTTGDKVLNLNLLNLETMQPETPETALWEVRGCSVDAFYNKVGIIFCLRATTQTWRRCSLKRQAHHSGRYLVVHEFLFVFYYVHCDKESRICFLNLLRCHLMRYHDKPNRPQLSSSGHFACGATAWAVLPAVVLHGLYHALSLH
jgi:hypothetical protein